MSNLGANDSFGICFGWRTDHMSIDIATEHFDFILNTMLEP